MRPEDAERARVEAEELRVVAEDGRVVAEGADPTGVEQGRREAEKERVVAETSRVKADQARPTYRRVLTLLAIPLALVSLVPSLVFNVLLWNYASDSRELIAKVDRQAKQIVAARDETRARFAMSDLSICREVEKLKKKRRDDALDSYRNLDRTLRLLGLQRTREIEQVARENRDTTLSRFAPREGGCRALPSTNPKETP